jgi:predicted metal-dependent hydrolase
LSLLSPRYVDGQSLDLGGVVVRLRVSGRARRISVRVDALRGEAVAVAPTARRLAEAAAFARSRREWIAQRLVRTNRPVPALAPDQALTVFGVPWRLTPDGRRPRLAPNPPGESVRSGEPCAGATRILLGCGVGAVDPQLVIRAIRREAQAVYEARAAHYCAALGCPRPPISLTDARTRWGSCTPARPGAPASIRLSWRLALAPFDVADYVVAHECAHLREANHGPRFWALVHGLVGDEKPSRAWLRTEGARLHALLPRA